MPGQGTVLPARRPEILLSPLGTRGKYVAKNRLTGAYYHLGEETHFLLEQLDGRQTAESICSAFEARFAEPLSVKDLEEFLHSAQAQKLLQPMALPETAGGTQLPGAAQPEPAPHRAWRGRSFVTWRVSLFDPNRLFNWLEPKVRFFWTPTFLAVSAACILFTFPLVWSNRQELAASFPRALCWQTLVLAWLTVVVATTCHEFAHGLTCKRFGGEVHEIGFLMMYLIPCFYCNVSDAWLFQEKSKRLWVTAAGGYCDLCLWALAVFTWRLTPPGTVPNYVAWVALTVCGGRMFFNFNPLLKLDGYYLLIDLLEIPNLRARAQEYVKGHVRWLLWGAPRPAAQPRGKFYLSFGTASWLFTLVLLIVIFAALVRWLAVQWGVVAAGGAAMLGLLMIRKRFRGFDNGELRKMIQTRVLRTVCWTLALLALPAALFLVQIENRTGGTFHLHPATRTQIHARVAGFLQAVYLDEGDRVSPRTLIARLEVLDLASRITQKQAEVREVQAKLDSAQATSSRAQQLVNSRSIAAEQWQEAERNYQMSHAQVARLREEATYLEGLREKAEVSAPVGGVITTAHLKQKVGQYFKEGDLICEVEEPGVLEAEVALPEQELAYVALGQAVDLKVRAFPFETFRAKVGRLSPVVEHVETRTPTGERVVVASTTAEAPNTLTVYCRLTDAGPGLRPGMSGYARIYCGQCSVARFLHERAVRYMRTEFWW